VKQRKDYPITTKGDAIQVSERLYKKYIGQVAGAF